MPQTLAAMKRKIKSAGDLQEVVETMKTMAAVNIGLYERVYQSLADYHQAVERALSGILRELPQLPNQSPSTLPVAVILFGSDQGMVGQYNDRLAALLLAQLSTLQAPLIWTVGERIAGKLPTAVTLAGSWRVPDSPASIPRLVGELLLALDQNRIGQLLVFCNKPHGSSSYEPSCRQLLPPDRSWLSELRQRPRAGRAVPEIQPPAETAFALFHQEYLFISLCRAAAEALMSENVSRLTAMQRAEDNIDELLELLQQDYNQERQNSITSELFDVIFGYTTLATKK